MDRRGLVAGLSIIVTLAPALGRAQGVEIDHKAVGCIIVGKYPKMNACFTPAPNLARGRVYFRPEGTTSWYYVDMKSDTPCYAGVLPKPGKKLVGKKIEYYVEGQDKTFNAARTAEFGPVVVKSAQECKKEVPVAPFLNNATVAVFPSLPAGFAAGSAIGTGAVLGIVGAGAAAVGTAVVVANHNNDNTTTTIAVSNNTTTTVAAATTTTTTSTTTTLVSSNHAPTAILKTSPDPATGPTPLTVNFDLCSSTDPDGDPLTYFFTFGDGSPAVSGGACSRTHTYTATSLRSIGVHATDTVYTFEGSVVDPGGLSQTRTRPVTVQFNPCVPGTPSVTITSPADMSSVCNPVPISATANGATQVQFSAGLMASGCGYAPVPTASSTVSGTGPSYATVLDLTAGGTGHYQIKAVATSCSGATAQDIVPCVFVNFGSCGPVAAKAREAHRLAAWSSDLTMDGRVQLVANGSGMNYAVRGRSYGSLGLVDGENRVEATLVESGGKGGLWRFDFMNSQALEAGSIRVLAGEVVNIAASSITFRLTGTAGERVAFTFQKK
jgi:PKD domain